MSAYWVQKYCIAATGLCSPSILLELFWQNNSQGLAEEGEVLLGPASMLDTVAVHLRGCCDSFPLVPLTLVPDYRHEKVVHCSGPTGGEGAKEGRGPCMYQAVPAAIAEGLHNALNRIGGRPVWDRRLEIQVQLPGRLTEFARRI